MRLSFPNGEHVDVTIDGGVVSIGSAEGNSVVLASETVQPRHARIVVDQRGIILEVVDPAARTHVNARPIVEKALLRLGDIVNLGDAAIVVKPDSDELIRTRLPDATRMVDVSSIPVSVVLRGVSGAHFGKTIAVGEELVVGNGRGAGLDIDEPGAGERLVTIAALGDAIHLRGLGSNGAITVNGVPVRDAVLHPGDQITFGRNRFVLEAPGYAARGKEIHTPANFAPAITQTMPAISLPEDAGGVDVDTGSSAWWLIIVAGVIGLSIAGLLWLGSR